MNARRVSRMWHERENAPLDKAIYWIEYVAKWGHAAKLHSKSRELPFYEYYLLDVIAGYIVCIAAIISLLGLVILKISSFFLRESKQKIH